LLLFSPIANRESLVSYPTSLLSICVGTFAEQALNEIKFREISTRILEKVIQYFYYKLKYTNVACEIPEFPIEPEIALELLMAANFLDT
jgi:elongin-C